MPQFGSSQIELGLALVEFIWEHIWKVVCTFAGFYCWLFGYFMSGLGEVSDEFSEIKLEMRSEGVLRSEIWG